MSENIKEENKEELKEEVVQKETVDKKEESATTPKRRRTTKKKTVEEKTLDINSLPKDFIENLKEALLKQIKEEAKTEIISADINKEQYTRAYLSKPEIRQQEVSVTSVLDGVVVYTSPKTRMTWTWRYKGCSEILTIDELLTMEATNLKFLHSPYVMVDDERIIEALGLKELYKCINKTKDLNSFLNLPNEEIVAILNKLSRAYKGNLTSQIIKGVKEGTITTNLYKIKPLETALGFALDFDLEK